MNLVSAVFIFYRYADHSIQMVVMSHALLKFNFQLAFHVCPISLLQELDIRICLF